MHQSHVIEVSGWFAGAAISQGGTYRFVAVDPRAEALDRSLWPSLPEMHRAVAHLVRTGRMPDGWLRPGASLTDAELAERAVGG